MTQSELLSDAIALLKDLIATPSISREEDAAAQVFENQLKAYELKYERKGNNIWCLSPKWEEGKPTLLLNAHIDTVKPVASWTRNPFEPTLEDDILYGLGSNDCGGGLVTLLQVYRYFLEHESPYNLIYLASAEEEVSGANG
ncbi:MAG: M20/M25/M40 family metallo-hydrolase, partial [Prevotella sp.]|nr:M20/M25/M40 family metallo-hydrolase [Prevotella sp.]